MESQWNIFKHRNLGLFLEEEFLHKVLAITYMCVSV